MSNFYTGVHMNTLKFELLAYQKIAGRYNADSLGYVLNTLAWSGNRFGLKNQYVAIFGS